MWKEAVVADLGHSPGICLEAVRKTTKMSVRIVVHWVIILTWNLPSTNQVCQRLRRYVWRIFFFQIEPLHPHAKSNQIYPFFSFTRVL
jgi:hypothetical protein